MPVVHRIIAVMLGRLRMDVQECIRIYLQLAESVFSKVHYVPIHLLNGRTKSRYNQEALESAIRRILEERNMSPNTLLKDEDPYSCKVHV